METYLNQYFFYLKNVKRTSDNTIMAYRRDLQKFDAYLENRGIMDISRVTYTDLNSYILQLEKNGLATASVSRNISTLKSFFSYLYQQKLTEQDVSINLKAPKIVKKVPNILSEKEMDYLLNLPDVNTPKGIRDKAILELLYATGIKVTELISIRMQDVNLASRLLTIADGKEQRIIPFSKVAQNAMKAYLNSARDVMAKDDCDYFFVNYSGKPMSRQGLWKLIKYYGKLAGVEDRINPLIFRHSFAAHMVENGADLKSLKDMLGHTDISATQIYSSFAGDKLLSVYEKAHKRK